MFKKIKEFLSPGIFPLTICIFLIIFSAVYQIFNFPSPDELFVMIQNWFNIYGLKFLFIVAFIEGIFIVGMYFPGSFAIALAVLTLGKTPLDLFSIGLVSYFAFFIANVCNYFLGKYGYYKFLLIVGKKNTIQKMHNTMSRHGNMTFFLTGFFPNFLAITTVYAGISNLKITKVLIYLALSLLFWISIWTIFASIIINRVNLEDSNQSKYILATIFLWAVFLILKEHFKKPTPIK